LLLGFFFFWASAWLCVCLSAFPWLGFHSLSFRLGALQTQRPLHTLNTCRCTICGIPYLHYVYVMTGVAEGGQESIDSLAGGKLEIQLTMHLSLSICAVWISCAQDSWDGMTSWCAHLFESSRH
jgi:hypothetical protein